MGGLIDLILDNMFLVVIVISGIIGVLSKGKEEQQQQEQRKTQKNPNRRASPTQGRAQSRTQPISTDRSRQPVKDQTVRRSSTDVEPDRGSSTSIAAEQQAQMEILEKRYGIATSNVSADDFSEKQLDLGETLKPLEILSQEQEQLKRNLRSNLKNKGLINGIIMAEVLGKPRPLNPYQSPTLERYKK